MLTYEQNKYLNLKTVTLIEKLVYYYEYDMSQTFDVVQNNKYLATVYGQLMRLPINPFDFVY